MRLLYGITDSMDLTLSKLWEIVKGQGSLVCSSPWSCKELDMPGRLNNSNISWEMLLTSHSLYQLANVQPSSHAGWITDAWTPGGDIYNELYGCIVPL